MSDDIKKKPDQTAYLCVLLVCMTLGSQQVAVKLAAPYVDTIFQIGLRSIIAFTVLFLGVLIFRKKSTRLIDGTLKAGIAAGILMALEYFFMAEGLKRTNAAHISVFMYTAPIFVAFGLHFLKADERMNKVEWAGVLLAFGGTVFSFLAKPGGLSNYDFNSMFFGDILGICSGLAWASTTIVIRTTSLTSANPIRTLIYQMLGVSILLTGYCLAVGKTSFVFSTTAVLSLGYQGLILCSTICALWFWLLTKYSASRISQLMLLTPVFGVIFGVTILGETISWSFIVGAACVLSGIIVIGVGGKLKKQVTTSKAGNDTPVEYSIKSTAPVPGK